MSGVQRRLQQALAFGQILEDGARLVLRRRPLTAEPTMLTSVVG